MNKRFAAMTVAALAACVLAFVLAGCSGGGSSDTSSAASSAAGGDAGTLVVGFDSAYPPYGYVGDDGEYTGFDLDLAEEVCKRNDWEFKAEPIDWDAKDALLGSGSITCIWNGFTLEGREGKYEFSEPYMLNEQVVVVKKGSDIKTFDDLAGKAVITQVDSAALDVLESDDYKDLSASLAGGAPQTISDYNNAFLQLDSGAVDAVACDLSIAAYQIARTNDKYVQLDEPLSSEHYAVGFSLGQTELADTVTKTLREMYEDGTVEKLCEKYADDGLSFDNWVLK